MPQLRSVFEIARMLLLCPLWFPNHHKDICTFHGVPILDMYPASQGVLRHVGAANKAWLAVLTVTVQLVPGAL